MIKFNFLPKFLLVISLCFMFFTVIGTLSHELGHIAVAEYLGYDSKMSYGSMTYNHKGYKDDKDLKEIERLVEGYSCYNGYDKWSHDLKMKVEQLSTSIQEKYPPIRKQHVLWVRIGGPAQTILTSLIGLLILYYRRDKWKNGFRIRDWIAVFLSLFILREVFNFVTGLYSKVVYSTTNFNGDEFRISTLLGYNEWVIPIVVLIPSLIILLYVIFKVIPLKYRFSFITSGLIGGLFGYTIWFGFLGEAMFN